MKLLIKIATVICLLLSVVWSQNNAIFFTTVLPEIPTSQDSVVLESMGFFTRGKLVDFTKAVSGNEFHLNFIVKDTTTGGRCKTIEYYSLGKLSEGNYKVITTTKKIKLHSYDTTQVKDTFNFQVVPPNVNIPKIVNQKCVNRYPDVNDSNPKNSYYYWNGDTLSIAIAFYWGSFETNYFVNYGCYNDTLFLNICDTMPSETLLYDGYIITASFFPAPHSTMWGKLLTTQFNRIIDIQGTTITAEWDEKELKKMNFSGTYLMRIIIGNVALSTNCTLM